jgi:hypothetical protein
MFDELCSIYADALDNEGRYVDQETGECIQQMTIREFCLSDRWKPCVEKLRAMRQEFGDKAKKMPEYIDTKKRLPGATLSGLFALYDDECIAKDGRKYIKKVSRRESHLKQHTGWLAIDIDLADNTQLSNFENIRKVCRFRSEIGLLMRSCSGTGYFGLVRLAYPDRHKSQFKALLQEYAALGITLDKACSNIGRVRFASWDDPEHIYINEKVMPYKGLDVSGVELTPTPCYHRTFSHVSNGVSGCYSGYRKCSWEDDTPDIVYLKAQRLVSKIEAKGIDIMGNYEEWVKCGISLYSIDHVAGLDMWRRISRFRPPDSKARRESELRKAWPQFANYPKVTENTFIKMCHKSDIFLTREELREIYGRTN